MEIKNCASCGKKVVKAILNARGHCPICVQARVEPPKRSSSAKKSVLDMEKLRANAEKTKMVVETITEQAKKEQAEEKKPVEAEKTPEDHAKQEFARRYLARKHLLPFVIRNVPGYEAGWVHKDICLRLERFYQDVIDRKSPRLMLCMPPRHGKSELASRNFPAWVLGKSPWMEVIATSYASGLANDFSRKVREIVRSDSYHDVFPECKLHPDSQSVESWKTTENGAYQAAGVGGPITGKGAHILIIDDPVKNAEDAESENDREAKKAWYQTTAYTRLAPGGGVLIIMTRWHDDDLGGWLLSEADRGGEKWELVKYPAIATEPEPYRPVGEALHPDRYDIKALGRIKRAVGPRTWEALYQQNPVPDDGSFFTNEMVRYYDNPPPKSDMNIYHTWDLAIGQKENNDYTVGGVWGLDRQDNLYLLDLVRGRMGSLEIVDAIIQLAKDYPPTIVGIERGQIEMAIGPILNKRIQEERMYSIAIESLKPGKRDKQMRARAIQGRLAQGKVFFPRAAHYTQTLVAEMLRFPNGKHDDQVDMMAWIGQMLATLVPAYKTPPPRKKTWRDRIQKHITHSHSHRSAMSA